MEVGPETTIEVVQKEPIKKVEATRRWICELEVEDSGSPMVAFRLGRAYTPTRVRYSNGKRSNRTKNQVGMHLPATILGYLVEGKRLTPNSFTLLFW